MVLKRATTIFVTMIIVFAVMQMFPLKLPTASAETVNYDVTGGQIIFEEEINEQFSGSQLDSSWQVIDPYPGYGRYSVTDNPGNLRYYMEGNRSDTDGWLNNYIIKDTWNWPPSMTLIREFSGDSWVLNTKVYYHLHESSNGVSTGAQKGQMILAFGEGKDNFFRFLRGVDYWFGANDLIIDILNNGGNPETFSDSSDFRASDDVGIDGWTSHYYWYRVERNGLNVNVAVSYDGIDYQMARTFTLPENLMANQEIILSGMCYSPVGSYMDWDYITVDVNQDQTAPTGLVGVAPASSANDDGQITGVTTDMEYRLEADIEYTTATSTTITGLKPGTYCVRYAAKTGYLASEDTIVVVAPYSTEEPVEMPAASVTSGEISSGTQVILSTTTDGATIYYTVDGSEPTSASSQYTEPITINESTTIKAMAVKDGMSDSSISTFSYTVQSGTDNYDVTGGQIVFDRATRTITGYSGSPSEVIIPSTINGVRVTGIGNNAFDNCDSLASISIPDSVVGIGNYAFNCCRGLTSISIPNSVTRISDYAFFGCWNLLSISIPDSVTRIGDSAFYGCSSLTSIDLPESVINIGNYAFYGCSLNSIIIPDGVRSIGDSAFYNCISLTSINIPDSITYIGDNAFGWCGITSISIPQGVTSINPRTFYQCESLTNVSIPDSVTSIGASAFCGCKKLVTISIPNGVISIGDWAFYYCLKLSNINIPDSVTSIGEYAFSDCDNLPSISIPNSVTSIGKYAFLYCYKLDTVRLPDNMTSISEGMFQYCVTLNNISIPTSVTSIGASAFCSCRSLSCINIPEGVTRIGEGAFCDCLSLTSISIPNSMTNIDDQAFLYCSSLMAAYFHGNAPTMGVDAFSETTSNFTVYFLAGKTGFTNPWNGYPAAIFQNSSLTPTTINYDKNSSAQTDVSTTMMLNGNTLVSITNGTTPLILDTDYSVNENTVTIKPAYLSAQEAGNTILSFNFSSGESQTLTITLVVDECFIATAAYGSKFQPAVVLLRQFRDSYLLTNSLGREFVNFYYHNSPPIAAFIAQSEPLKALVRMSLLPVIILVYSIFHPGVLGLVAGLFFVLFLYRRKVRNKYV